MLEETGESVLLEVVVLLQVGRLGGQSLRSHLSQELVFHVVELLLGLLHGLGQLLQLFVLTLVLEFFLEGGLVLFLVGLDLFLELVVEVQYLLVLLAHLLLGQSHLFRLLLHLLLHLFVHVDLVFQLLEDLLLLALAALHLLLVLLLQPFQFLAVFGDQLVDTVLGEVLL